MARRQTLVYRPELDGVRAVAILAVLVAHAKFWYPHAPTYWGARGVDLFFVLSGFLITALLCREQAESGQIAPAKFYARRAIRLLPALVLAVVIGGVVTAILHGNGRGALPYRQAVFAALLFEGNWFKWKLGVLDHTWSLGLEEQYYLLWPLVMGLALRRGRSAGKFAAALALAAVLITVAGSAYNHGFVNAIWPSADVAPWDRAGGVLIGSALGVLVASDRTGRVKQLLRERSLALAAAVGVLGVISLTALREPTSITAYDFLLVLYVCFALLIGHMFVAESSPISAVFRAQPLPAIGRISYGLYLFHWPIFTLVAAQKWTPLRGYLVAAGATFVTAIASYLAIERPELRLKDRLRPQTASPRPRRRRAHRDRDVSRPVRRRSSVQPVRAA